MFFFYKKEGKFTDIPTSHVIGECEVGLVLRRPTKNPHLWNYVAPSWDRFAYFFVMVPLMVIFGSNTPWPIRTCERWIPTSPHFLLYYLITLRVSILVHAPLIAFTHFNCHWINVLMLVSSISVYIVLSPEWSQPTLSYRPHTHAPSSLFLAHAVFITFMILSNGSFWLTVFASFALY